MPPGFFSQEIAHRRAWIYAVTGITLFGTFLLLRDSTWEGSRELHTVMEVVATLLALMVGVLGLVRYYTKPNNTILLIGAAFLGTALLDGYHAVVTSQWFDQLWPSPPPHLIPWSWNASRTFLAIMMSVSWLAWRREARLGSRGAISARGVFLIVGLLTAASFIFFAVVPLPRAYYPELPFGRPQEFVSALFFLLALLGYLHKGGWKTGAFEHWVVLSLIVGFVCQAAFMSSSFQLYDGMFDLAHMLKKLSYICVLIGLLISLLYVLLRAEQDKEELTAYRDHLETLVCERTAQLKRSKEAAEVANRSKSVFLANMSHELRTPLNAILGFAQLMRRDPAISGEQRKSLETIDRSGQHLLGLINDVLEISGIEAGSLSLNPRVVDLPEHLSGVVEVMDVRAGQKGLSLRLEMAADLPPFIEIDADKLRQVLIHLLSNAVKYTRQGGVTVRVSRRMRNGKPLLDIEVEDTGPGMAPEELDRIFHAFYQTEHGIALGEGAGLGLTICREYAALLGGEITAESEPGTGSVFRLLLPLTEADSAAGVAQAAGDVVALAAGQEHYRILVAAGDADDRWLITRLLQQLGLSVEVAGDAGQAIERARNWQPHLIWLDMELPVIDGYVTLRRIRALPECAGIRIAALTSSVVEEERQTILDAGCDGLARKPVEPAELLQVIQSVLGLRYLYEEQTGTTSEQGGPLDARALAALPEELRHSLRESAEQLDVDAIRVVIRDISAHSESLAAALEALVTDFRFDVMLTALQEQDSPND